MTTHDPGLRRHKLVRCSRLQIPSLGCRARSLHAVRRRRGRRGNGDMTWSPEAVSGPSGELNRFATSEMGREGGVPERLRGGAERKTQLHPEQTTPVNPAGATERSCAARPGVCALRPGPAQSQRTASTYLRHVYAPDVVPDPRGSQLPQATRSLVFQGRPRNGPDGGGPRGQPQLTQLLSLGRVSVSCVCHVLSACLRVQG